MVYEVEGFIATVIILSKLFCNRPHSTTLRASFLTYSPIILLVLVNHFAYLALAPLKVTIILQY